ncbi:MAG: hypothetical protein ACJ8G3_06365 [Burkholderiaceae bacterium]
MLGKDDGFAETHLGVARVKHQQTFHPFQCLRKLPALHEPRNVRLLIDRAGLEIAGKDADEQDGCAGPDTVTPALLEEGGNYHG